MMLLPPWLLRWQAADIDTTSHKDVMCDPERGLVLRPGATSGSVTSARLPATTRCVVPSWHADTAPGTWIEVLVRAEVAGHDVARWTRWYNLGVWSLDEARRRSVEEQADEDGKVATDTLLLSQMSQALQWRVVLHGHGQQSPALGSVALAIEPGPAHLTDDSAPAAVDPLPVPELSQMVYPGGGPVWCSPTALTMLLGYWYDRTKSSSLARFADPQSVLEVVAPAVYDPVYDGTGNWPFNTAFAAAHGLEAYVLQLRGLPDMQRLLETGVPMAASIRFGRGELDGTPQGYTHTSGHLLVVVGLTQAGDVIVNDPRADSRIGESVRRVYKRDQFRRAWKGSGYSVYLVYPRGWIG